MALLIAMLVAAGAGAAIAIHVTGSDDAGPSATVRGSGISAHETRTVSAFRGVDLAGTTDVTIHVGGRQSVVVRGDDNLLRRVTTRVRRAVLTVGETGTFTTRAPMSVEITVPALRAATLSGTGSVWIDDVAARRFAVTLAGTGTVRAGGSTRTLDVSLSGDGEAQLAGVVARDVRAVLAGSGQIVVTATRALDASVPGTGSIVYGGKPASVVKSITGTGAVARG